MKKPLISIIVPIYNSEKFLDKCVQSILNQTLKDIEIILVDDASPDNSIEIMQKYAEKDERIVIIRNKTNGHPNSRNAGILAAKANYLGFVDADDWVDPDMYKKLYDATKGEQIDVVVGEYEWVYTDGKIVRDSTISDKYITGDVKDAISGLALNGGRLFTNIWRKDLIVDNNLLFMEDNYYCDFIVTAWYMTATSIGKVSEPFYKYRINAISVTAKKDFLRFFDRLESSKFLLNKLKDLGVYEKYREEADYVFYRLFFLNSIVGAVKNFTKPPYAKISEIKSEFCKIVNIGTNKYYKKAKWKKWHLLCRIVNWNTIIGVRLAKCVNALYSK